MIAHITHETKFADAVFRSPLLLLKLLLFNIHHC